MAATTPPVDPNNPYGLLGGGTPKLGNGALYVPPNFNNMPTGFGYSSLNDQLRDAMLTYANGAGGFANNASPVLQSIKNAQPTVGGGLLGTTAYSGSNPWTGWDPYQGRGNGPGGPGGPPGGPSPPGAGGPPGGGLPPPGAGAPPGVRQPPPGYPGTGQPPVNPRTNPTQPLPPLPPPTSGITPNPPPPGFGPRTPAGTQGGLLTPRSTTQPPQGQPPVYPTPTFPIADIKVPGAAGNTDPQTMVNTFMSLPENQRMDYFNAISQYGLTQGQNLGGALDMALRQSMGADQFKAWLSANDNKQGSTINGANLPEWLRTALGG